MMTDIWEVWKDICHSNHVMKIKVKVLGPVPKGGEEEEKKKSVYAQEAVDVQM